jgi:hypothetical protein
VNCLASIGSTIRQREEWRMSSVLIFATKWKKWYQVLRYRNRFGLFDSLRFGLWLAR